MIANNIQAVVNQLIVAPTFLYGSLNELNLLTDSAKFPVVMLYTLKPIDNNTTISNAINEKFSIYMEFLFLTPFDNYTSQNEIIIEAGNEMKNEFLVKLEYYRQTPLEARFFRIDVNEKAKVLPVYNKLDVNSTGVSLSVTLETMSNIGYDPTSRPIGWVPGIYG